MVIKLGELSYFEELFHAIVRQENETERALRNKEYPILGYFFYNHDY